MQNGLVYFSFSQLFKHGVHLGLQSTLLHSSMLKYLLPFNYLKFNLFNLNFAYASLRLVSNFILTMSSLRKFSLVVNSVSFLDDFLVDFFSGLNQPVARGLWVAGRLTNFRFVRQSSVRRFYLHKIIIRAFARIESLGLSNSIIRNIMNRTFNPIRYKQSVFRHVMNLTRMPRFCFINDSVINAVSVNECFILDIPSICSSDSGSSNHYQITYPIPGNSVSLYSVLLYYSIHKYSMQRGIYKERYLFILNTIKNKLKVASILKQLPIAYKLRLKTNVLAGIDLYTVPFTKVKMKLDVLSSSILNLNLFYKLLSTYNLFFTSNIGKFKKLMKKYVLLVKSISMYSDYLETIYNNNNKSIFLSRVLDQKFYSFILAINPNVTSDFSLKILKFLTIGDAVISSVLSDLYSKFNLTTNLLIKPYYISTNFLVVFDKKSRIGFLSLISKFIYNFNVYPNKIGGLFSELFYNQYTLCNLHSLSFAIDLFSINFLNLYKKLFLITSTLSKISNFFAFGNFINHYNVKFNSAASIRLF